MTKKKHPIELKDEKMRWAERQAAAAIRMCMDAAFDALNASLDEGDPAPTTGARPVWLSIGDVKRVLAALAEDQHLRFILLAAILEGEDLTDLKRGNHES